jgi:hypothetical protein
VALEERPELVVPWIDEQVDEHDSASGRMPIGRRREPRLTTPMTSSHASNEPATPWPLVNITCPAVAEARKMVLHVIDVLIEGPMKTNVTLKLDADLIREARVMAAEEGRSISALLTDRLETMVRDRKAFDKARRRALARLREGLDLQWTPPKSRDELHER